MGGMSWRMLSVLGAVALVAACGDDATSSGSGGGGTTASTSSGGAGGAGGGGGQDGGAGGDELGATVHADWALRVGHGQGRTVGGDGDGNVVFTGELAGELALGGELRSPEGEGIELVVKLDAAGSLLWAIGHEDEVEAAAVASSGEIYLGGGFDSLAAFGGPNAPAFLVALHPDGSYAWSASGASNATGVAVDPAGNVYVAGFSYGQADLGGGPVLTGNGYFAVKYDAAGAHLWSHGYASAQYSKMHIAVNAAGAIALGGPLNSVVDFGMGELTPTPGEGSLNDGFVVGLAAQGDTLWSISFGDGEDGSGGEIVTDVAIDGQGGVIFVGTIDSAVALLGEPLPAPAASDTLGYVAKLDATGGHAWQLALGGDELDRDPAGLVMRSDDGVVVGGVAAGALEGTGADLGLFYLHLDSGGAEVWNGYATTESYLPSVAVGQDGAGNLLTTGAFAGTIDFGTGQRLIEPPPAGFQNGFIAKIARDGGR